MGKQPDKGHGAKKHPDDKADKSAAVANGGGHKTSKSPEQRLQEIKSGRPGGIVFFFLFLASCTWLVIFSNTCAVKPKKDCGWSGVSPTMCLAAGSILTDSDSELHQIGIKRTKGQKLGFKVQMHPKNNWGLVTSILEGAASEHNGKLSSEDEEQLRVGDKIIEVNGAKGKSITSALKKTDSTEVTLKLARLSNTSFASRLPGAFWEVAGSQPLTHQLLLTSGFNKLLNVFAITAGSGTICWLLSGFPAASLPVYYWGTSAFVAWWTTGACYNDQPSKPGDPHCYCSTSDSLVEIASKAWGKTSLKQMKKFAGI
eukprot:TRINITY_DN54354_c0_g1_i1.p1 TRINITY_DN54354_c0_g1~~TRINITY_DN54354_c0_g1_i1.p1  ORF type:complete len:314 (+),score=49.67 TRINITY_DN54354_c0_g1_i1:61-1002(+)